MKSTVRRPIAAMLAASMFALSLPASSRAGIVPTHTPSPDQQRVEQVLVQHGVDPAQAKARAAALTNEEAARVAAEFDATPAGAGGGGGAAFCAIVILMVASIDAGAVVVLGVGLLLAAFASSGPDPTPGKS